jgi:uncharacterized protein YbjT (DUF2867 family)
MHGCAPLVAGLRRAGFSGGWLDAIPRAAQAAPAAAMPTPEPLDPPTPPDQTSISQGPAGRKGGS